MRKLLLLSITLLFVNTIGFAQISEQDLIKRKIVAVYGEEFYQSNPEKVKELTLLLEERIQFLETPYEAGERYQKISAAGQTVMADKNAQIYLGSQFNSRLFNPLMYQIEIDSAGPVMYRIDDTKYILLIQPE